MLTIDKLKSVQIPEIRGDSSSKSVDCSPLTVDIFYPSKEIKMKCKDNSVSVVCKGQALRVASENLPF
mgnify:CR=1 FL=1